MQKIGAQYLLKKASDIVMAPPKEEAAPEPQPTAASAPAAATATPVGPETIEVELSDGSVVLARRLDVAVYAVTWGKGRADAALARALEGENAEIFTQRTGSRISSIIYVPDRNYEEPRGEATRADDI